MQTELKPKHKWYHMGYEQGKFDGVMDLLVKLSMKTRRIIDKELNRRKE